jgi:tRNA modification GTPase
MLAHDTILAVASPPGRSAVAIIRASGPACPSLVARSFVPGSWRRLGAADDARVDPRTIIPEPSGKPPTPVEPRIPGERGIYAATLRLNPVATDPIATPRAVPTPNQRPAPAHNPLVAGPTLPVLVLHMPAPASYTGQDSIEIQIPGNPALVRRTLDALLDLSHAHDAEGRTGRVRLAEPGEFTARAYLNGRLTLEQAEGVAGVIAARSREQLDAANRLLSGSTGTRYRAWRDELLNLLALVEAGIDFTDQEDVVAIASAPLDRRLAAVESLIAAALGGSPTGESTRTIPRVALVGPPNAGKSTLFNALIGRDRAVVSPRAGTTRDALAETIDLSRDFPGAGEIELLDLPGLDEPNVGSAGDRAAQVTARHAILRADALIHCDPSGKFHPLEDLPNDRPTIRVRTKADLPAAPASSNGSHAAPSSGPPTPGTIAVGALDGWNLRTLIGAIADLADGVTRAGAESTVAPRHRRSLAQALVAIAAARARASASRPDRLDRPEEIAESLRDAAARIGDLTGAVSPDEVLGRIFSTFCVGK